MRCLGTHGGHFFRQCRIAARNSSTFYSGRDAFALQYRPCCQEKVAFLANQPRHQRRRRIVYREHVDHVAAASHASDGVAVNIIAPSVAVISRQSFAD